MHEYGVIYAMMQQVVGQIRDVHNVCRVRLRRGVTMNEFTIREAYRNAVVGTPLEAAELVLETAALRVRCTCGHEQLLTDIDLVGHFFPCPHCGTIQYVSDAGRLELVCIGLEETCCKYLAM